MNEAGRRAVVDHPGRFGLLASLPLPDVDAADRRDRALLRRPRRRRLRRCSPTSAGPTSATRRSQPVFRELDRRGARLFIHPTSPVCWEHTSLGRPRPMLEFLFDTTRAVVNLVLNGTVAAHPDLEFIDPARRRDAAGGRRPGRTCFALLLGVDPSVDVLRDLGRPPLRPRRLRRSRASSTRCSRSRRSSTSTTAATSRSRPSSSPRWPPSDSTTAGDPPGLARRALRANTERLFPRLAAGVDRRSTREELAMHHQIELGYLVLELPEPDVAHAGARRRRRPRPRRAGRRRRAPGATTIVPSGSWCSPARRTTRSRSASRRSTRPRSTPPSTRLRAIGADVVEGRDDDAAGGGSTASSAPTSPWGVDVEVVLGLADGGDAVLVAARAGRLPHRRRRVRARRVRHDGVRRVGRASSPTASGFAQSDWLEMELAPGHRRSRCGSSTATPATTRSRWPGRRSSCRRRLHHVMFEANVARRRRRRLRPGLGGGAADPERARPARQRRDVQLLPADPGRLPDRVRPRRARRRATAGTTTGATTASAPGATSRCASREHADRRGVDCDVAIVGAGPSGLVLAVPARRSSDGRSSSSSSGPTPYTLPRAVHFDDEVGRILQSCGIGDELRAISEPAEVYEWRNAAGTTLLRFGRIGTGASGWPFSSMFCQPELEALLDGAGRVAADDRDPARRRGRRARAGRRPRHRRLRRR